MKNNTLVKATPEFLTSRVATQFHDQTIHLLGIEYDGTASFRKGARLGPNALRAASDGIEEYSPYLDKELTEVGMRDLGNLVFDAKQQTSIHTAFDQLMQGINLKEQGIKLITLGGEHSISYSPIKHYLKEYPDLVLLHLDAHADLRDGYLGEKFSHASIIRRVLDHFGKQHQLIQYGIRSGTKEEYQWMREQKTLYTSLQSVCDVLQQLDDARPIYLTLDLDYFDPAYFPGTGTPEAGGEDYHSFVKMIKILAKKNFVGADITELAPQLDTSDNSSVLAAKVVREVALSLASSR